MKIKLDFVTNSSTTSFVAWGVTIDTLDLIGNEAFLAAAYDWYIKTCAKYQNDVVSKDVLINAAVQKSDSIIDLIECVEIYNLEYYHQYDSDKIHIGRSPFDIKEDETPRQFKEQLSKDLAKLGIHKPLIQIEESSYDG